MRTLRAVCEAKVRELCRQWALAVCEVGKPLDPGRFDDFYAWIERTHPEYLRFKPSRSVVYWVGFWFEQECERAQMRRAGESWPVAETSEDLQASPCADATHCGPRRA
ncbi:hypothetical protein [Lysobacter enzymogenes]|uniref:hypothetical protein n=1 Tax=Lysobacter enzymogenes TaxID=69 RepID=UPI00089A9F6E|nr:hypothetical protein [Lysobacter enzymogenes]SDX14471.1 hypothetical protein SAMN05421681_1043 [Lysobacter enzymogenes]